MDNNWVELRCGSSRFRLAGLGPDDFPEQHEPDGLRFIDIPKRLMLDMVDRTLFSVSHDETRPSLNGVFFRITRDGDALRMIMVSTDGHRLSKSEVLGGEAGDFDKPAEAILHHKAISELRRSLEGDDANTRLAFHRGNVFFANDEVTLQVRELDETFPDYSKVIPKANKIQLQLSRAGLADSVKRIATLTSNKTHIIKFEVVDNKLILSAQNPEAGEARDEIEVPYDGEILTVGFNYKYMLDVLNVINGDTVTFSINDQYSPGLITSEDDEGSLFVIMPMRI